MKKIKLFLSLISFSVVSTLVSAQVNVPNMTFTETTFDFGKIKEDGGTVTHKFLFTNTGAQPVIISQVKASCGCTTPDWSKDPVAPGAQGFVSAIYNPQGRPGVFNKSITVTSNSQGSPQVLYINGEVLSKELTVEEVYKFPMDAIRLKNNNVNFGLLFNNEKKEQEVEFINTSDKAVTITFDKRQTPAYIDVKAVPASIAPNAVGKIIVSYDASKVGDWDYVNARVGVTIDDKYNPGNALSISATISEKFSDEQIKNPPQMQFMDGSDFDFGTIKQGAVTEHIFKFTNSGKSDLIIHKTGTSCGCTVVEPKNKVIKPGETSELKVVFNSTGKSGPQTKIITVITNEPGTVNGQDNFRKLIKLTGTVNVEQANK
jgi:hypothetical protein